MDTKYLFFHTAKAAVFQFYAFVILLSSLFYIKLTLDIPQATVVVGTTVYIIAVIAYAFHIDRAGRGKRGA